MICKNCDEGLVVGEVIVEEFGTDKKYAVVTYSTCTCCMGNYSDCKNCKESENASTIHRRNV
jgi:hypothetical protein